jgi:uncharacterized repeat protein (TIGR02543 family)
VDRLESGRGRRSRKRMIIFALLLVVLMAFCATTAYATPIGGPFSVYYYVVHNDYGNAMEWNASNTISFLKSTIAGDPGVGIAAGDMVLVYNGTVMQDADALSVYNYVSMQTIYVYRASDYYDADLSDLTVSHGTLTPSFSSGTEDYSVIVPSSISSLTLTATASNSGAGVAISGSSLGVTGVIGTGTGSASRAISLATGPNVVTVVVTPLGGSPTKTYTVTITRLAEEATVTFDSQGGSAVATVTVDVGNDVSAPTAPTRSGYTFKGWYLDDGGTLPVSFPYAVTGDTTLYAAWTLALTLTSSDEDGVIYLNGRITLTPNFSGGTWTFNSAYVTRSGNDFTALKSGTVQITYAVDGVSVTYNLTIRSAILPSTGQDMTPFYVLACLSGATIIAAFGTRMRRFKKTV